MAVLVGMFLALVAATVWVPVSRQGLIWLLPPTFLGGPYEWRLLTDTEPWARLPVAGARDPWNLQLVTTHVRWPILIAEHALVLLLGGGLLTWVVRRERRQRAEAGA